MKMRKILLFTTLSMAAAGASGNACLPEPEPVPNSCSNDFDLAYPFGDETSLISSIESGNLWTAIKYRFKTGVPDSLVLVSWQDKNGAVLFSGSNSSLLGYLGAVDLFQWGETRRGIFPSANTSIEKGTADFTGSEGINLPCLSYVCDAGYHEFLPSPFSSGSAVDNRTNTGNSLRTDPQVPVTEIQGAITLFEFDPVAPGDLDLATAKLALDYTSTVEWSGTEYLYRYSITNHLDQPFDVSWEMATLTGSLDPGDTIMHEFSSLQRPGIIQSMSNANFGSFGFSGGMGLLTPVPIPASLGLFASAIAGLAMRRLLTWGRATRLAANRGQVPQA